MKTNAIIRIILYSIIIMLLLSILIAGITMKDSILQIGFGDALDHNLTEAPASFDARRISRIEIDWAAGSIRLTPGESDNNEECIFVMTSSTDEKYPVTYEINGNTLKISYTNASVGIQFESIPSKDLTITVPHGWICDELEIDGAALDLLVADVSVGALDVDGADCSIDFQGFVETVECDGAACSLDLNCTGQPKSIDMNGAACELELTLPAECGFEVEMNGLDCRFNSSLSCTQSNGVTRYGDAYTKITADGIACEVTIHSNTEN